MYIPRFITPHIQRAAQANPVIGVIGPRQTGKTTLVRRVFPDHAYANLENPQLRALALDDPQGFLATYPAPLIIDEAQYAPDLFSYIQVAVDENRQMGQYILTGSQHFLMMESISQSLSGRIALFELLPLAYEELKAAGVGVEHYTQSLFRGGYPRLYEDPERDPSDWFADYERTYVERDLRMIQNVSDLRLFQTFIRVLAGRTGQLLNLSEIGRDVGISHNTVQQWLSILETSFITFRLSPYYKNFDKRLVKSPKIYFHDTGLVCWLLGIQRAEQLRSHPLFGNLFENWVIAEYMKHAINRHQAPRAYFWRNKHQQEIDLLIDRPGHPVAVEIKAGATITESFFRNLDYWHKLDPTHKDGALVYGGTEVQRRTEQTVYGWSHLPELFDWIAQ